jgi:hypothetical protein
MILRKVLLLLAAIVAASATLPARAQLAAYGTFSVNRLSNIASSPEPNPNNLGTRSDSVNPVGGVAGVYYNFAKIGPVQLGADARAVLTESKRGAYEDYNGGGTRLYSGLGGIRAQFHTKHLPLKPYIEGAAGIARTNYGLLYNEQGISSGGISGNSIILKNNFQYMGYGGLDFTLMPFLDIRVVEGGIGGINPFGTYSHNYPVYSLSTGIVFRFPF